LAVIIIDIDHIKMVNDDYGHLAGDACLKLVANVLKGSVNRPQAKASRFVGEEFTILLQDTPREGVLNIVTSILKAVKNENIYFEGLTLMMTVSIGFAIKKSY
jgi:diguanylate cyclase (GGDEF)-like protein